MAEILDTDIDYMFAPLSKTIRLTFNSCVHAYISFINTFADKISIFKVHICYLKRRLIMSNSQCMFVSQRNIREKIVLWSTIPLWETHCKALTCQCFLFIFLFKKKNLDPPQFRRHLNDITRDRTYIDINMSMQPI